MTTKYWLLTAPHVLQVWSPKDALVQEVFLWDFSITVQRNHMIFGVIIAPSCGYISLTLGPCNSFRSGVVCILLSTLDAPFKCTVDTTRCGCVYKNILLCVSTMANYIHIYTSVIPNF